MRRVIFTERDGKYVAIDNPDAIVFDNGAKMIRQGLDHWIISRPTVFGLIRTLLENAGDVVEYNRFKGSQDGRALGPKTLTQMFNEIDVLMMALDMSLETIDGVGYRLHLEPRETLECCATVAPGQPLPSRVRSMRSGRSGPHMKPVVSPTTSISTLRVRARQRRKHH
jgi:hypothetical protein